MGTPRYFKCLVLTNSTFLILSIYAWLRDREYKVSNRNSFSNFWGCIFFANKSKKSNNESLLIVSYQTKVINYHSLFEPTVHTHMKWVSIRKYDCQIKTWNRRGSSPTGIFLMWQILMSLLCQDLYFSYIKWRTNWGTMAGLATFQSPPKRRMHSKSPQKKEYSLCVASCVTTFFLTSNTLAIKDNEWEYVTIFRSFDTSPAYRTRRTTSFASLFFFFFNFFLPFFHFPLFFSLTKFIQPLQ